MGRWGSWQHEHGFTLVEVMTTIILLGIVLGIATSTWFGVVESRRVDSATNEVAAVLRFANAQAENRLINHTFVVSAANSQIYQVGPTGGTLDTRTLPEGAQIAAATTIVFKPNGEAQVISGAGSPITVRSSNDTTNNHTIEFNSVTSRIRVVP